MAFADLAMNVFIVFIRLSFCDPFGVCNEIITIFSRGCRGIQCPLPDRDEITYKARRSPNAQFERSGFGSIVDVVNPDVCRDFEQKLQKCSQPSLQRKEETDTIHMIREV